MPVDGWTSEQTGFAAETSPSRERLHGRYEVLRELGHGAFATVFLCEDHLDELNLVAVKCLHEQISNDLIVRERFKREAHLASQLRHDNIVGVKDCGVTAKGIPFLVMEYIDGSTLRSMEQSKNIEGLNEKIGILVGISRGLECAHQLQMTHRDIKPDNILMTTTRIPRITDFGVAKCWEGDMSLTVTGDTVGTPVYMSPEQFKGGIVDARTDIYAFGILAYELFTGSIPFIAQTYQDMASLHLKSPVPSLVETHAHLPRWLDDFVQLCTQKNPRHRYQNMQEVLSDLTRDRRTLWRRVLGH